MLRARGTLARVVIGRVVVALVALGVLFGGGSSTDGAFTVVALVAVVATSAAIAASARRLLGTLGALLGRSNAPRPCEAPELAASISQSVPDAPGRPQPRAPGRVLAAA